MWNRGHEETKGSSAGDKAGALYQLRESRSIQIKAFFNPPDRVQYPVRKANGGFRMALKCHGESNPAEHMIGLVIQARILQQIIRLV